MNEGAVYKMFHKDCTPMANHPNLKVGYQS